MGSFFGLDIGSAQVKVLQVATGKEGLKVAHFGLANLTDVDPTVAVRQAIKESGIKGSAEVNLALPESEIYTRIIKTSRLSETELASSIKYEAEQYVPVSLEEVELYHQVLSGGDFGGEDKKTMRVLLIAVPKERLKKITDLMDKIGLIPKSLETELFSLKRVFADASKNQVLLLFGHKTTDLMILNKGVPVFLHSMASGGLALTKNLSTELDLTEDQAEQYKRTYGLREDLLEGKIAKTLSPMIDQVVNQINKAFVYVQQLGLKKLPEQLIVAGGGAALPGLSSYLVKKLNVEVIVGNPFSRFIRDEEFKKIITNEGNSQLSVVTGLAIKGLI